MNKEYHEKRILSIENSFFIVFPRKIKKERVGVPTIEQILLKKTCSF